MRAGGSGHNGAGDGFLQCAHCSITAAFASADDLFSNKTPFGRQKEEKTTERLQTGAPRTETGDANRRRRFSRPDDLSRFVEAMEGMDK